MSGDIEDFLRRAAERRQARQAKKPAPPPARPSRPEYSDSRRERAAQWEQDALAGDEDDAPVIAQQVETPLTRKLAELKRAQAAAQAMRDAAPEEAVEVGRGAASAQRSSEGIAAAGPVTPTELLARARLGRGAADATAAATAAATPSMMDELRQTLSNPQGLRSAMLLHEILSRPEHRW